MDEWLERYLDMAAHEAVGAVLLDARPAFVASADGAAIVWANAAGIRLFRAPDLARLAGRRLAADSPLRLELARLSRLLPADRSRLEALPFPLMRWTAACRRLNLPDGTRAVLAVGAQPEAAKSVGLRAGRLAEALAGEGLATAVLDADGGVIGGTVPAGPGERQVRFSSEGLALILAVGPARPAETMTDRAGPTARALPAPPAAGAPALHWLPDAAGAPPGNPTAVAGGGPLSGTEVDAFRRIREALARSDPRVVSDEVAKIDTTAVKAEPAVAAAMVAKAATPAPVAEAPAPPPPRFDEALLDRLAAGVVIYRERRVLFVNRALLDLTGYETPEAFTAAGGTGALFADGNGAWSEGDFDDRPGRLAVKRRDGSAAPAKARLNTVTWDGARAFMLTVIARPSEPEPAADQPVPAATTPDLRAAERRIADLETILDTATDGVLTVDRHGMIETMNRAAEALFAVSAGEMRGRSFTELLAEESRNRALDYLDGLTANGVKSVLNDGREVIGKVPGGGGLIPLSMTMGRIGDSGRFCAVLSDITHWKTVEEEMTTARREAEAANAQKSEFLAKMSHEIRTPLNAIIGFSEIMTGERFGPIGNERYRAYLNDIHASGRLLMSLINDLLDLSKIEAGKVEMSFESVAVNAAIQECVAIMQPLANRERIIIRTSLSTDLPNVVADARSFRQILLNLMSNAIKFTRAGGQVIVSTLLAENGELAVRIRDTGIGMSPADIETAMKPFEQVSDVQDDRDKGTGLGLPLTKAMVEANRASFAIESGVNQGTLVRITFPTTRVLAG